MKLSELTNKNVAVWGGGRDGRAAAQVALQQSCSVLIMSDAPDTDAASRSTAADLGLELIDATAVSTHNIDFVVRSPGISRYRPDVTALHEANIPSSNLFALWLADQDPSTIIGVTGTKGKSTTSLLITDLLRATGKKVELMGNIGVPVTTARQDYDFAVVEVSSYQASDCTTSPAVGVLTSLGQDHLTWHGSVQAYHRDKLRVFAHEQLQYLAFHDDDLQVQSVLDRLGISNNRMSSLRSREHIIELAHQSGVFSVMGSTTFTRNLMLAIAVVESMDNSLSDEHIINVLQATQPLPSRQHIIGSVGTIEFVDDALASNPLATMAAIERFTDRPLVLIVGGQDRTVDYSSLITAINSRSDIHVVLMGQVGDELAERLQPHLHNVTRIFSQSLIEAVKTALHQAPPHSRIIFSPAAPTPPELGDYTKRSLLFRHSMEHTSSLS